MTSGYEINEELKSVVESIKQGQHERLNLYEDLAPVYDFIFADGYNYGLQAEFVCEFAKDIEEIKLLDVGCGTGKLLKILSDHYPNAEMWGVDLQERMIEIARGRLAKSDNVGILYDDFFDTSGNYNIITAMNVLPHFSERELHHFFDHVDHLLDAGGALILDYKDPRENPNGLYDRWRDETDKFVVTTRFITIYNNNGKYYAISYEIQRKNTEQKYFTGELMRIYFQKPDKLCQIINDTGQYDLTIQEESGDQSGVIIAKKL